MKKRQVQEVSGELHVNSGISVIIIWQFPGRCEGNEQTGGVEEEHERRMDVSDA